MFAPAHHQATRFVVPVRRELAVRTIFNLLGPLTNPAGARRQLIGVSDAGFLETIAGALARLGVDRALVVAAEDGLDELSVVAATKVVEVNGEEHRKLHGRARRRRESSWSRPMCSSATALVAPPSTTQASPARSSASTVHRPRWPRVELAVINAGAAIYAAGACESIADGVQAARAAISDGGAAARARALHHSQPCTRTV